jgi:hypothetical protein
MSGVNKKKNTKSEDKSSDAKIINWVKNHKILLIIASILVVVIVVTFTITSINKSKEEAKKAADTNAAVQKMIDSTKTGKSNKDGTDVQLLNAQPSLEERFGKPPAGYIRDWEGSLISKGDKSKTAEQVTYAYLKAISTLDMATAQKYSRGALVVKDYNSYFDTSTSSASTSTNTYQENLFRQAMLSVQVKDLGDTTSFAGNKHNFTANISVLDLQSTDFINGDMLNTLSQEVEQHGGITTDDSEGAKYLQNWIINYYKSDKAPRTNVSVTLTVQKYPDLNTGWLVSIDKQLDDKFKIQMNEGAYYYIKADILGINK